MSNSRGAFSLASAVRSNHRHLSDRRRSDLGPPNGWCERRKRVERRLPDVEEDVISESEWFRRVAAFKATLRQERIVQLEAALGLTNGGPEGAGG